MVEPQVPDAVARAPRPLPAPLPRPERSRWQRSTITFGPTGRVVSTIVLFLPVIYAIFFNVFFVVAAALWLMLVPMALRDIWRPVRRGDAVPSGIVAPPEEPPLDPNFEQTILIRGGPKRW